MVTFIHGSLAGKDSVYQYTAKSCKHFTVSMSAVTSLKKKKAPTVVLKEGKLDLLTLRSLFRWQDSFMSIKLWTLCILCCYGSAFLMTNTNTGSREPRGLN